MFSAFFDYKITLLLCPNLRKNTYILFLIVFNYQYIMFFSSFFASNEHHIFDAFCPMQCFCF